MYVREKDVVDWYAIQTKARQEAIAEHNLRNQAFRTHLPLVRTAGRRRGRWQPLVEPLFPGYLFVQLDVGLQDTVPIRSTRGVVGLVRFGSRLCPVPNGLVEALIENQPDDAQALDLGALFPPGSQVSIVDGPFWGLKAIVEATGSQDRVHVLLELLGQSSRLSLSSHQVAPLHGPAGTSFSRPCRFVDKAV